MDTARFDRLSRLVAQRRLTRREALARGGAGLAAGAVAAAGLTAATAAQDATPEPASEATEGTAASSMLFLQTYRSGTITPVEGVEGRYTLTLEAGTGQTVYFSDRPERIVGADPTPRFLEGLGFPDDNPPNAALVVETAPGETDIAVVELYNPLYDPVSRGVTYEVEVLANWQDELGMGFSEAPTDLAALAPSFGAAQLFIDDCPNETIYCMQPNDPGTWGGTYDDVPLCWNYGVCMPCEPYGHTQPDRCATQHHWNAKCNADYYVGCPVDSPCYASWAWWGSDLVCSD